MKRSRVVCLGFVLSGSIALACSLLHAPAGQASASAALRLPEPNHAPITLDVRHLMPDLDTKSESERAEQIADWAVYATLVQAGLSAKEIRDAVFDIAPTRHPALSRALDFARASGRRVLRPDGTVWLFHAADDPHAKTTLARLADQARTELGRLPSGALVFAYTFQPARSALTIRRASDLSAETLFSPAYGYHAATITNLSELEQWLSQVDDLTHASLEARSHVELGGRRLNESRSAGITLEEISTLFRAHGGNTMPAARASLQPAGFSLDVVWDKERLLERLSALTEDTRGPSAETQAQIRSCIDAVESTANHVQISRAVNQLRRWMETEHAKVELLQRSECAAEGGIVFTRCDANRDGQLEPRELAAMRSELFSSLDGDANGVLSRGEVAELALAEPDAGYWLYEIERLTAAFEQQCARYDGPLRGTQVGMKLYYTDLLGKLWTDLGESDSPEARALPGLPDLPSLHEGLPATYWDERSRTRQARIWFSAAPERWKLGDERESINFDHLVTRVYSAGQSSKSEIPDVDPSAQAVHWWDDHLEQIADYEPQFHAQNQILKWSVLLNWLLVHGRFAFLGEAPAPDTSLRFDRWLAANEQLRYRDQLPFVEAFDKQSDTECLAIMRSRPFRRGNVMRVLEGGVGLATPRDVAPPKLVPRQIPVEVRRAGIDSAVSSADKLVFKHATYELPNAATDTTARVLVHLAQGVRSRVGAADIHVKTYEQRIVQDAQGTRITLAAGQRVVRTLIVHHVRGSHLQAFVYEGTLDAAVEVAKWVETQAPITHLPPGAIVLEKLGSRVGYLSAEDASYERFALDPLRDGRASLQYAPSTPSKLVQARRIEPAELTQALEQVAWQRMRVGTTRERIVDYSDQGPGPNRKKIRVHVAKGQSVEAFVDKGTLYFDRPTLAQLATRAGGRLRLHQLSLEIAAGVSIDHTGEAFHSPLLQKARRAEAKAKAGDAEGVMRELAEQRGELAEIVKQVQCGNTLCGGTEVFEPSEPLGTENGASDPYQALTQILGELSARLEQAPESAKDARDGVHPNMQAKPHRAAQPQASDASQLSGADAVASNAACATRDFSVCQSSVNRARESALQWADAPFTAVSSTVPPNAEPPWSSETHDPDSEETTQSSKGKAPVPSEHDEPARPPSPPKTLVPEDSRSEHNKVIIPPPPPPPGEPAAIGDHRDGGQVDDARQ